MTLPRIKAKLTRKGFKVNGLWYAPEDTDGLLIGDSYLVAYDPADIRHEEIADWAECRSNLRQPSGRHPSPGGSEMASRTKFLASIKGSPPLPYDLAFMSEEGRRQALPLLLSVFIPMDYMYAVYDQLYRAIRTTYTTQAAIEEARQTNALFRSEESSFATQADTGSILGVPGIGKTSTIRRCLFLMPQVIEHTEYWGQPFFCKQVLYLRAECPSDCSIKTLAFNLLAALDRAIGSDYIERLMMNRHLY